MLVGWLSVGLPHDAFWDQTFRTLPIWLKARGRQRESERKEWVWHTWHAAALQRAQKMPSLGKMMASVDEKKQKRRQTWQEQYAIMEMWRHKIDRQNARMKN